MVELLSYLIVLPLILSVVFVGAALMTVLNGWVLTYCWLWFIVPVFGLPPLTIGQAVGITFFVGVLKGHGKAIEQLRETRKTNK